MGGTSGQHYSAAQVVSTDGHSWVALMGTDGNCRLSALITW
ncbi:unnamed protein product [Staurois parvus]|uniref:Uncharacterized protein n=1 Tax=Staurois parvus TaxID=386267 RepID=A0ABN9BMA0_9NEOB|nr:unnamed protein product [Staurois parvus]